MARFARNYNVLSYFKQCSIITKSRWFYWKWLKNHRILALFRSDLVDFFMFSISPSQFYSSLFCSNHFGLFLHSLSSFTEGRTYFWLKIPNLSFNNLMHICEETYFLRHIFAIVRAFEKNRTSLHCVLCNRIKWQSMLRFIFIAVLLLVSIAIDDPIKRLSLFWRNLFPIRTSQGPSF